MKLAIIPSDRYLPDFYTRTNEKQAYVPNPATAEQRNKMQGTPLTARPGLIKGITSACAADVQIWIISKLDDKKKGFLVDFHRCKRSAGIAVYLF
jgi:hypothetical protein